MERIKRVGVVLLIAAAVVGYCLALLVLLYLLSRGASGGIPGVS